MSGPGAAINIMEFEAAAREALSPAHFAYLATGVDDDLTLQANRDGFARFQLRPRRLVDITRADLRVELFGRTWDTPIGLAPVGNQKAFHDEGEMPVVRAAKAKRALFVLSTTTTSSLEEVTEARGEPVWFQLYPTNRWEITERLVKRAGKAGCPVLVLTVDTQAGRRTETLERARRLDSTPCAACHGTRPEDFFRHKPLFEGLDMKGVTVSNPSFAWEHVRRLRSMTPMKLLIKGIETREDARICLDHGVDGIIVSNHGGRAEESGRGTIECLPEVVDAVGGRLPVMIDGGFRRGTDVFKAIALGAKAVFIGRPYIWGLSAFGQAGVERVHDMLVREFELVMKQCGTRSIAEIGRGFVMSR